MNERYKRGPNECKTQSIQVVNITIKTMEINIIEVNKTKLNLFLVRAWH